MKLNNLQPRKNSTILSPEEAVRLVDLIEPEDDLRKWRKILGTFIDDDKELRVMTF